MPDTRRHPRVQMSESLHDHTRERSQYDGDKKSERTDRPYLYRTEKTAILHEKTTVVRPGGSYDGSRNTTKRERQLVGNYLQQARKSSTNSRKNYDVVEEDYTKQTKRSRVYNDRYATDHKLTLIGTQRSRGEINTYPDAIGTASKQIHRDDEAAQHRNALGPELGGHENSKNYEYHRYYQEHMYHEDYKSHGNGKNYEDGKDHGHHEHLEHYEDYADRKDYHEDHQDHEEHGDHEDYDNLGDCESYGDYEDYEDSGEFEDYEDCYDD